MKTKVLGVCGSPIKGGNTETFLGEALKGAYEVGDVETELLPLAGKDIRDCIHCNWCLTKQEEGKFCALKDDMVDIFPKVMEADGLLVASPVYVGRLSGYTADFLDRLRVFGHGNHYRGKMKYKASGALSVCWYRNAGVETTLLSIIFSLMTIQVQVVSPGFDTGCAWGAGGLATYGGTGRFNPKERLGILKDKQGLRAAYILGQRVVETARLLKAGREALDKSLASGKGTEANVPKGG